ncbi:MAG: GIY-YIG nuclease family protein [Clostridium celatum]|nr:GIY-YIG nuclease family protein [Clostridium celatum]
MTKEEKRRREHNEYVKEWNRHSESYKEYQKKYHRLYRKKHKGHYIYFFISRDGEVVYVGKTTNIYSRMAYHKSTREYWEEDYTVLYHEFKDINDDILVDIESMLISLLNPVKNSKCADYDGNVDKYLRGFKELKEYQM